MSISQQQVSQQNAVLVLAQRLGSDPDVKVAAVSAAQGIAREVWSEHRAHDADAMAKADPKIAASLGGLAAVVSSKLDPTNGFGPHQQDALVKALTSQVAYDFATVMAYTADLGQTNN